MKLSTIKPKPAAGQSGSTLIAVLFFTTVVAFSAFGMFRLTQYAYHKEAGRVARTSAYYHAENALLEGVQLVNEQEPETFLGEYDQPKLATTMIYSEDPEIADMRMRIVRDPAGTKDDYIVLSTAKVRDKQRTLRAKVTKGAPASLFDYEYFLNNWAWWWGSSITGYGDQRSNWDFDFRFNPIVNGSIMAAGGVESNLVPVDPFGGTPPFLGVAGADPLTYVRSGVDRLPMPNLSKDFAKYAADAKGTIAQAGATLVDGVYSDAANARGIYLEGTDANPIVIEGKVVVYGDAIIKGKITGKGTLYVGGNLYVAGDMTYANGPDFSAHPGAMQDDTQKTWVENSMNKDLVAFAVKESILVGQVNSSTWKGSVFDANTYGLKHHGDETNLGADGIPDTGDDGVKYLDTNSDGTADSAWYDADGDGAVDSNYNYDRDLKLSDARRDKIDRYPKNSSGTPQDYNNLSTGSYNSVNGIFYTNHAYGYRSADGGKRDSIGGLLICRDEAWVFSGGQDVFYDPRVHSKYLKQYYDNDGNKIIDLGLPGDDRPKITRRDEMTPEYFDSGQI